MSRDPSLFVDDMITACDKILRYDARRPQSVFESDEQAFDAVLKNLEVIGEAANRLPAEVAVTSTISVCYRPGEIDGTFQTRQDRSDSSRGD